MNTQGNQAALISRLRTLLAGGIAMAWASGLGAAWAQAPATNAAAEAAPPAAADEVSTAEQGQTHLDESFDWKKRREQILGQRRDAIRDTKPAIQVRTMYLDRNKFDGSESEAWALGGSAGFKTGFFRERLALGLTGYTSQPLHAPDDKDGTLMLKPGQEGYTVLGEIYGDLLITDDLHAFVGRKAYDTPYINRNDVRMTPNTFEALTLQGRAKFADEETSLGYGAGYFNRIKERNSEDFVMMSEDAGAEADRGVYAAGANLQRGGFALGAIDYYSEDIINIAYGEAKYALPLKGDLRLKLAAQYSDQRSTGDELLTGEEFTANQFGVKADLPVGGATFTLAYTDTGNGDSMQNPWSGYPGYTSVQVEDFNRAGEEALLLRAAYAFSVIKGLSAYALWVSGTDPEDPEQYAKDEYDFNLQWSAPAGVLKGLTLRGRYAIVQQDGGDVDDLDDFRIICTYDIPWG